MKNIKIELNSSILYPKYRIRIERFWSNKYIWKSSSTSKIYLVSNVLCATEFNSHELAMLCAEEYLLQKKKK